MPTLSHLIDPILLKHILWIVVAVMLVALALLFGALIAQKWWIEAREWRTRKLCAQYMEKLNHESQSGERPVTPLEIEAYGLALSASLKRATGERRVALQKLAIQNGIVTFYAARANSLLWTRRVTAMEGLAMLALPTTRTLLFQRSARENDPRVLGKIIYGLAVLCEDASDLSAITRALSRLTPMSSKYNEFIFARAIRSLRALNREYEYVRFVKERAGTPDGENLLFRDMIEAAGKEALETARPCISALYRRTEDRVMRVTALRALGNLHALADGLGEALLDDDWRIRAVAARYGWQGGEDAIPLMKLGLRDENYHVRINAAVTMTRLGPSGVSALKEEATGPDPFARQMAAYALRTEVAHA